MRATTSAIVMCASLLLAACGEMVPVAPQPAPAAETPVAIGPSGSDTDAGVADEIVGAAEDGRLTLAEVAAARTDRLVVRGRFGSDTPFSRTLDDGTVISMEGDLISGIVFMDGGNAQMDVVVTDGVFTLTSNEPVRGSGSVQITSPISFDPIVLVRPVAGGEVDLGVVPPKGEGVVFLGGRVIDTEGAPVEGARVATNVELRGNEFWKLHFLRGKTDSAGQFAIRAHVHGAHSGTFTLDGEWSATALRALPFEFGSAELEISARRFATVSGKIVVPDAVDMDDLVLVLDGTGSGRDGVKCSTGRATRRGGSRVVFPAKSDFTFTGLEPGFYDIVLRYEDASDPLAKHRLVEVGERDMQLPPLEVTRESRELVVRVTGAGGRPVSGAQVWVKDVDDRGGFGDPVLTSDDGTAKASHIASAFQVMVTAAGHAAVEVVTPDDRVSVEVAPCAETEISVPLPEWVEPTRGEAEFLISARWIAASGSNVQAYWEGDEKADPRSKSRSSMRLPESGAWSTRLTEPGWYEIELLARWRRGSSTTSTTRELGRVHVDGSGTALSCAFPLDEADMRAMANILR